MHAWESIQITIEYIEKHMREEISIEKLAEMAALSPFYYQRLFSRLVKKPVGEYIKLRRLAKSIDELKDTDKRILDIALGVGFSSHESLTRAFKERFGMTPDDYRKNPVALNRMTKPELLLNYVLIDEGVPLVTEGIVLEINRRTLTAPVYYAGCETECNMSVLQNLGAGTGTDPLDDTWNEFHAEKVSKFGIPEDAHELGVMYASENPENFKYFAGGETTADKIREGDKTWVLPEGEYVICDIEAENFDALVMDALYKAQKYLYDTFMANHKLQSEGFCAERYPSHDKNTTSMELWLKLIK